MFRIGLSPENAAKKSRFLGGLSKFVTSPDLSLNATSVKSFSGWTNLDTVLFTSTTSSKTIGLDKIMLESSSAAVPEPATASIHGLGTLVGAFCQYRRRKRVAAK